MSENSTRNRRRDDPRIERLLAKQEFSDEKLTRIEAKVDRLIDGDKLLPQCADHRQRISGLESRAEKHDKSKSWVVYTFGGGVIAMIAKAFWEKITS